MSRQQAVFDPVAFKATTRQQWDTAAEAWSRWSPLLSRWLGPATETMLDMAGVDEGSRVLDVAAGAGEQSIAAARRCGPSGHVLATDLSPEILKFAAANARRAGLDNLQTMVVDGESLAEIEAAPFDAVISRVGLIYFPDQHRAVSGMRAQLRPGGKVGAMSYSRAEKNPFFSIPVGIIRRWAGLPAPLPGQPGPFSLADPDVFRGLLADAGFSKIDVEVIDAPVRLASALECLQFEQESFGALHQMLSGLSAQEQDDAWAEIEDALRQFESGGHFEGPCEMVVAVGTRPDAG